MIGHGFRNVALGLALAGLLSACGGEKATVETLRPAMVTHPQPAQPALRAFAGDVRARYEPALSFRVGGKIARRLVNTGAQVKKGDLLAELDAEDLSLQVGSARAAYAAAQAAQTLAQTEFDRAREMLDRKLISQSAFDARANALAAAKAQADSARAALEVANNQKSYAQLVAPGDGTISQRLAEAGQVVAAGQTVFVLALDGERDVAIGLPEQEISKFSVGQRVYVELWSRLGQYIPGTIRELAPSADPQARTYAARVSFQTEGPVDLGQTARVFVGNDDTHALTVPLSSVGGEEGRPFVWVIDPATSQVQRRDVVVANWAENRAVISEGLSTDDWVVVGGVHLLKPGQRVKPIDRDNRPVALQAAP